MILMRTFSHCKNHNTNCRGAAHRQSRLLQTTLNMIKWLQNLVQLLKSENSPRPLDLLPSQPLLQWLKRQNLLARVPTVQPPHGQPMVDVAHQQKRGDGLHELTFPTNQVTNIRLSPSRIFSPVKFSGYLVSLFLSYKESARILYGNTVRVSTQLRRGSSLMK